MPMEKTFNAAEAEARLYAAWEEAGCFTAGKHVQNAETGTYCVMIPPPNVTGVLHIGHAFNNTLQDILTRWHRMRGFDTLWQPGTDHAGIATQMVVERQLAESGNEGRKELGRDKFLEKVWEWKSQSGGTIVDQLKRLGASCDWSREAFTMSGAPNAPAGNEGNFHDAVIKVFVAMYEQGLIYRGKRLVNWDPKFETAISDLEVENIETPGHMWHFKYPLADGQTYEYLEKDEDGNVTLRETRDYISIATTRPETMLGDGAVAVHPSDERYAPIVGKLCEIPVGPKEHRRLIPIITDPYPDPDFGSGAVKITGAHDFNDYQVAKRGGIPMYRLMAFDGSMRADGAPYAEEAAKAQAHAKGAEFTETEVDAINLVPDDLRGLDRFDARKKVVEQITSEGLAVMVPNPEWEEADEAGRVGLQPTIPLVDAKPIMQPFGDRSKVVIEPMLTNQWFVDTDKIVGPALDAVKNGDVKILPESGEKVYYHWLENIEPWCISRQLWWGHQIPVWYGPRLVEKGEQTVGLRSATYVVQAGEVLDYSDPVNFCAATFEDAVEKASEYYGEHAAEGVVEADLLFPRKYEDYDPKEKAQV
ncbi:MAG: class I tRNA ligase family protein, partial [Pseudomonadota bacterium]